MDWEPRSKSRKELTKEVAIAVAETATNAVVSAFFPPFKIGIAKRVIRLLTPATWNPDYYQISDPAKLLAYYHRQAFLQIHFKGKSHGLPFIVEVPGNAEIALANISFVSDESEFSLDPELQARTDVAFRQYRQYLRWRRRRWHNGRLLRLRSIDGSVDNSVVLRTGVTSYEDVCRTHMCLDVRESKHASTLREFLHPNGALCSLPTSRMANALGVNFLLFTADEKLIVSRRSNSVAVSPGLIGPSVGGDFEAIDTTSDGRLVMSRLLREPFEEIGLRPDKLVDGSLVFLGLTRELARGGKPDVYFRARTTMSENELRGSHRTAADRWENKRGWLFWPFDGIGQFNDEAARHRLRTNLDALLSKHRAKMSHPLLCALALWSAELYADRGAS